MGGKDIDGRGSGRMFAWHFANHFRIEFPLGLSICLWTATVGAFISKVVDKFVCGSKCDSCEKLTRASMGNKRGKWGVTDSPNICQDVTGTDNDRLLWART